MISDPTATTWGDLATEALREAGYLGIGTIPLAEDLNEAIARAQWMVQQWERQRWLIFHLVTYLVQSDGRNTPYSIGPTGPGQVPDLSVGPVGVTSRPNRLESAFFRQLVNVPNGPVDYNLKLLPSFEDYNQIALKKLTNFQLCVFYDPAWPLGQLYCWPWPQASIYQVGITVREQLPQSFKLTDKVNLPYEYYSAVVYNLALRIRPKYGLGSYPGDELPGLAREALVVLRKGNTAIPNLSMPAMLARPGIYNIFSDTNY